MEMTAIHPPVLDLRHDAGPRVLARVWRDLEDRAGLPTQGAGYLDALCATLLAEEELALFQVESEGRFDAALPLCRAKGRFARWRQIGDDELGEPGDALYRDSVAAWRLAKLIADEARPIVMQRVPAGSAFICALREAMDGRGTVRVRPAQASPTLTLDPSWGEPETKFSARRRSDFRRAARRAAEFGEVVIETLAPCPKDLDALFDEAVRIEAASWKREAGTAIACDPAKEAFFRSYLKTACVAGACRVSILRIGGRGAAMQLAVEWAGRHWLFKIGHDDQFSRCSPGNLLMLHTIAQAAQAGCRAFELMGEAEGWIADLWTRESHPCMSIRTYPHNSAGALAWLADAGTWARFRLPKWWR